MKRRLLARLGPSLYHLNHIMSRQVTISHARTSPAATAKAKAKATAKAKAKAKAKATASNLTVPNMYRARGIITLSVRISKPGVR